MTSREPMNCWLCGEQMISDPDHPAVETCDCPSREYKSRSAYHQDRARHTGNRVTSKVGWVSSAAIGGALFGLFWGDNIGAAVGGVAVGLLVAGLELRRFWQ